MQVKDYSKYIKMYDMAELCAYALAGGLVVLWKLSGPEYCRVEDEDLEKLDADGEGLEE